MKDLNEIRKLQTIDNLPLLAKQTVEGFITGLHKSPYHGFSVEFAEHRLYNKGESTKHIDWKLYARTDRLYVKRYEEETNLRCRLVIDTSSSMYFPEPDGINNKLAFSLYSAASLIYLLKKQRDAAGVTLFSNQIEFHSKIGLSDAHTKMLFAEMNHLLNRGKPKDRKATGIAENLHRIAETTHKRSLVVIFSDLLDNTPPEEIFSALRHLRYNKHEVILFHVTDFAKEALFEYQNRPHKFVDMETGESISINPGEIKSSFKQ
ncbi:MAG TPA: DUF58 domain-containing protein, partial [Bacteroidales bacterium]|nr:DUF58 domain-containing protein [Bacteroidales bacterium]